MKQLILEIIKDIIFTFVFYFGVVFFGCKAFGDNPFDLKLFIIVFITFSLVCISFDVIDYIYAKRSKNKDGDDSESDTLRMKMIANIITYIISIFLSYLISLFIHYCFDVGLLDSDLCVVLLFMFIYACFLILLKYFISRKIHKKDGDEHE